MSVTIRDVAAAAGVSPATVSRVLNHTAAVRPEASARVLRAVRDLGYRPNGAARGLRTRTTRVLGLIISDITNPFFTGLVRGVEDAAQQAGYSVVLANSDEDLAKEANYLEIAAAEQMAGVVLSPASATESRIDVLTERQIPVVTVDRLLQHARVDSVTIDNRAAALEATQYLVAAGARRIAMVTGPRETTTATGRLAGYRAGLREAGLPARAALVRYANYRVDGGYHAVRDLLAPDPRPDGLLVANNLMTVGALAAVEDAGLRIPRDLTLAGFDDMSWALGSRRQLALVAQPTHDIGYRAAELLLWRVQGDRAAPRRVVLGATLLTPQQSRSAYWRRFPGMAESTL